MHLHTARMLCAPATVPVSQVWSRPLICSSNVIGYSGVGSSNQALGAAEMIGTSFCFIIITCYWIYGKDNPKTHLLNPIYPELFLV